MAEARPKPVFSWYIGDEQLSDLDTEDQEQEDDSTWTQTLLYTPEAGHANRSLRCEVEHIALGDDDDQPTAEVLLKFTPSEKELLTSDTLKAYTPLIVTSIVVVLFLAMMLFVSYKYMDVVRRKSSTSGGSLNEEGVAGNENAAEGEGAQSAAAANASPARKDEDLSKPTEDVKDDSDKAKQDAKQPEAAQINLKERIASIFRFGTTAVVDEEAAKVEEALEEAEVKAEESNEKVEAEVKEATKEDETNAEKTTVETIRESGMSRFLKLFKKRPSAEKTSEEELRLEEASSSSSSGDEKAKADEAENEKGEEKKPEEEEETSKKETEEKEE